MFGLILIALLLIIVMFRRRAIDDIAKKSKSQFADKLDKLWEIARESINDKKYLRAEKALLTILRIDERNATAYNRLGILYAKQQAFADAIECFEIAQSLEPSASSLHNAGLIYLDTGKLEKAAIAFEQAIEMEEDVASRHIAYAKVQEKIGDKKRMFKALERAVELDRNPQSLRILADTYEREGREEEAFAIREEVKQILTPPKTDASPMAKAKNKRIKQPRKVL